jgi:hypothetical protein
VHVASSICTLRTWLPVFAFRKELPTPAKWGAAVALLFAVPCARVSGTAVAVAARFVPTSPAL